MSTSTQSDIKTIVSRSGGFLFLLFLLLLLFFDVKSEVLYSTATKFSFVLLPIITFWGYYIKSGWKHSWLNKLLGLKNIPNLQGRWEGKVCRLTNDEPHPFVVEVTQTYTSISYRTFSTHSKGKSVCATILKDHTNQVFEVVSLWNVSTRKIDNRAKEDSFQGTSIWSLSLDGTNKRIEDRYFTNREPQTKGTVVLTWKSKKLLNRFKQ